MSKLVKTPKYCLVHLSLVWEVMTKAFCSSCKLLPLTAWLAVPFVTLCSNLRSGGTRVDAPATSTRCWLHARVQTALMKHYIITLHSGLKMIADQWCRNALALVIVEAVVSCT